MREGQIGPAEFFHRHRGGRDAQGALAQALEGRAPLAAETTYWSDNAAQSMLIEEVEEIWAAIAERDDWNPLAAKIDAVRALGDALGPAPVATGHLPD